MGQDLGGIGDQGQRVDLISTKSMISYRVVEDIFSDSDDGERAIDVVIQTTDPDDFADFDEAVEEAMDRIQEKIDLEELSDQPDRAHLALLEEKLGDTGEALGADWEAYCFAISQPIIFTDGGEINLAEVEGRGRFSCLAESGQQFDDRDIELHARLSRQAECGTGGRKIKAKTLKTRPRPELDLAKAKIDPILAAAYGPELVLSFLTRHKQSFEAYPDWKPHRTGFLSDLDRPETSESYIHVLTVFLDGGVCVTFAVAVPTGQLPPDDRDVMDAATVWVNLGMSAERN